MSSRNLDLVHRVVIVDDKPMIRQALCKLFRRAGGFEVCGEAANGQEAITLAKNLRPDLIVLDMCMPGMSGLETAHQLKKLNLPTRTILYTLNAEEMAAKDVHAAGVAEMVSKAEGVGTLIDKARSVLN